MNSDRLSKRLLGSRAVLSMIFGAVLIAAASPASAFDQVIVFGDSYSDLGNINIASNGVDPATPYYKGRYSNGPIWIEDLAVSMGLTVSPSLTPGGKGRDYAYGGAEMTVDQQSIPSLITQTNTYLAAVSGKADPQALYVVWGGINDLLVDWDENPSALPALPNLYAQAELKIVTLLKKAGAKSIMIGEVQDAGKMPAWNWSAADVPKVSADAAAMNAKAVSAIDAGISNGTLAGVTFYVLPAFEIMDEIVAADLASESASGPPYFSLTNVVSACVDSGEECATPNQYLFWDGVHPTVFGHSLLAERALGILSAY